MKTILNKDTGLHIVGAETLYWKIHYKNIWLWADTEHPEIQQKNIFPLWDSLHKPKQFSTRIYSIIRVKLISNKKCKYCPHISQITKPTLSSSTQTKAIFFWMRFILLNKYLKCSLQSSWAFSANRWRRNGGGTIGKDILLHVLFISFLSLEHTTASVWIVQEKTAALLATGGKRPFNT